MIHLNCDIGEMPAERERDLALLRLVDAVSIACGGHAGDADSARFWQQQATTQGKQWHLHLSYPDREHFGRRALDLSWPVLREALEAQRACLPDSTAVKFHGALYHRASTDMALAEALAEWCVQVGIQRVLAPPQSAMTDAAQQHGLQVLREGFADRRYCWQDGRLQLAPRSEAGAVHDDPQHVIAQIRQVLECGQMPAGAQQHAFACDTWCIHSDSPGALLMAQAIRRQWP
ncbi:MAG: hypothetical protein EP312_05955 [Gammaproteobacteria bacterium]|nr:MAG: hypothetical protein EP312_05955 [Gammaproteobacteria bacterium]